MFKMFNKMFIFNEKLMFIFNEMFIFNRCLSLTELFGEEGLPGLLPLSLSYKYFQTFYINVKTLEVLESLPKLYIK